MNGPPANLDGARVLEYAIVDESVTFTGRLHLYHGDTRVGTMPYLAICENPLPGRELLLFHCDEGWNVLGAQIWNAPDKFPITSVEEIKQRAENFYGGISAKWISLQS